MFFDDVKEKLMYIRDLLQNPQAADTLLDNVEEAILERLENAESFEPYHSLKERRFPYYRIYVGNYIVYYVVIRGENHSNIMEVRRFLYKGQNRDNRI